MYSHSPNFRWKNTYTLSLRRINIVCKQSTFSLLSYWIFFIWNVLLSFQSGLMKSFILQPHYLINNMPKGIFNITVKVNQLVKGFKTYQLGDRNLSEQKVPKGKWETHSDATKGTRKCPVSLIDYVFELYTKSKRTRRKENDNRSLKY